MMAVLIVILAGAFEYPLYFGSATGMATGLAIEDWHNGFEINPALALSHRRFAFGIGYSQPYGISGLNSGLTILNLRLGKLGFVGGGHFLGFEGGKEVIAKINIGVEPLPALKTGLGIGGLIQDMGIYGSDAVLAFDFGLCYQLNKIRFGIAGRRLNSPRLDNGEELLPWLGLGLSWEPVSALLLALDLYREGKDEGGAIGVEFRFLREIAVRAGVATFPFQLTTGLGVRLGWFGLDYGYKLHPELGDTHILSLNFGWD